MDIFEDNFEKEIIAQLKVIETQVIALCRVQHNLVVSLKEYSDRRKNGTNLT